MLCSDFTSYADTLDCIVFSFFLSLPLHRSPCTIQSTSSLLYDTISELSMYDINLGATTTTIPRIRGVQIPIDLVSSTTDSFRWSVVLFKLVPVPTSDPKSEFLCQSSLSCTEPTDPLNTSYAWDISHALVTTYHPYCHSPSALTEYLKQKLRHQRAKRLGRSPIAQVEQNIPLERNRWDGLATVQVKRNVSGSCTVESEKQRTV